MSTRVLLVATLCALVLPGVGVAQEEAAETPDLDRVYTAADSVNGRPVLDSLPQLIDCPRFEPRDVRGDETTFSFERRPELERRPQHLEATIEFVVRKDGKVDRRRIRVLRSTDSRLERSLEYWLRRCVYRPGKIGEHAVEVRLVERFEHRLNP